MYVLTTVGISDRRPCHGVTDVLVIVSYLTNSKSVQYTTNHTVLNTDNPNPIRKPKSKLFLVIRWTISAGVTIQFATMRCAILAAQQLNWLQNDLWRGGFPLFWRSQMRVAVRVCTWLVLSVCLSVWNPSLCVMDWSRSRDRIFPQLFFNYFFRSTPLYLSFNEYSRQAHKIFNDSIFRDACREHFPVSDGSMCLKYWITINLYDQPRDPLFPQQWQSNGIGYPTKRILYTIVHSVIVTISYSKFHRQTII